MKKRLVTLLFVLSLLLPSAAIWAQPSAPSASAALVKPSRNAKDHKNGGNHEKQGKKQPKKSRNPVSHKDHKDEKDSKRKANDAKEVVSGHDATPTPEPTVEPTSTPAPKPTKSDGSLDDCTLARVRALQMDALDEIQPDGSMEPDHALDEEHPDPAVCDKDETPAPTPEAAKLTKKERRAARQTETAGLVSAAAFAPPAPAQDARMIHYYGAADGDNGPGNGAYFPWQFSVGFDKIEDAQRPVNGKSSHWVVTDCTIFCGWDIYNFRLSGNLASADPNWARFEVNRPTTVGYVQRDAGGPPAWLAQQGWVDSGIVTSRNPEKGWTSEPKEGHVYVKEFPAGMITIPGPGSGKVLPWILFAEAGGARPTMPNGYTPNEKCSDAIHNQFKTRTGYPTWHNSWHQPSWCYFEHEHGSNPALIFGADVNANMPEYGYFDQFPGHKESHFGHKGYAITHWPEADFYVTQHFGTTGVGRFNTCEQRFHLVEVSAMNKAHTILLYKIRFMADYGEVVGVSKGGDDPADDHSINPPGCPDGNAQAAADAQAQGFQPGVRREAIDLFFEPVNEDGLSYGPWRFAKRYENTLGLKGAFVVNTQDGLDSYRSHTDLTMISQLDRSGTARFFTINETEFHCPNLPATKRGDNGYWFTDMMGTTVYDLANRPANAVRQFCKPGWTGTAPRQAGTELAAHLSGPEATRWGGLYVPRPGGMAGDFERSIQDAHGPN